MSQVKHLTLNAHVPGQAERPARPHSHPRPLTLHPDFKQVKQKVIRPVYSSPPLHGARLASEVLGDAALFEQWQAELDTMASRVRRMRHELADELRRVGARAPDGGEWSHITDQIGMFAYTGLSAASVDALRERHHIYMTRDGRLSMAALKPADVGLLAAAMAEVLS